MSVKMNIALGVAGGAAGFILTLIAVFYGTESETLYGESLMVATAMAAMGASTIAIIGAAVLNRSPRLGGWLMCLTGLALPFFISTLGFIPFVFLIPAGIAGIIRSS